MVTWELTLHLKGIYWSYSNPDPNPDPDPDPNLMAVALQKHRPKMANLLIF